MIEFVDDIAGTMLPASDLTSKGDSFYTEMVSHLTWSAKTSHLVPVVNFIKSLSILDYQA